METHENSPTPNILSPSSKYSLQNHFFKHPQLCFLKVKGLISHMYRITGEILPQFCTVLNFTYADNINISNQISPITDPRCSEGSRKLSFPDYVTVAQDGGKVVSLTHRPHFTPRKYSWYSFLLEAESTPATLCDRKDYVNEKFQWHHLER